MIVKTHIDRYDVVGEYFSDLGLIEPALKMRDPIDGMDEDFLGYDGDRHTDYPEKAGFCKTSELRHAITFGVQNPALIGNMCGIVGTLERCEDEYTDEYDIVGDEFDVDAFYAKEREFMYTRVYADKFCPRVNIIVEMGVSWGYTSEQILQGSSYIVRMMKALEMQGSRVELIGTSGATTGNYICSMLAKIKGADEPVNYPRLLVLASPMFQRGIVWSWESRSTRYMDGYGYPIITLDKGLRRKVYDFIKPRSGQNVVLTLREIIDHMDNMMGDPQAIRDVKMDAWLREKINEQL